MTKLEELALLMCKTASAHEPIPFTWEGRAIAKKQAIHIMSILIEAMREPNNLMRRAAIESTLGSEAIGTDITKGWRAMIDAILNEKP